jgi:hypothetical protein
MNRHTHPARRARVVTLLAVLMVTIIPGALVAQTSGRGGLGVVEFLDGDVKINGVPADFGQVVEYGDWAQTGPDSSVDIVFDGANVFRLGENTVASIEIGTARQSVDLKHGSFAAVFDRLRTLSGRGTFDVRTPTVVGGVRGTSFFVRVVDSATTYVCTCNGTLELDALGSDGSFLETAAAHSAHYFRETDGTVDVEAAPMSFHSSDSLNKVADIIDVTVPWGSLPE